MLRPWIGGAVVGVTLAVGVVGAVSFLSAHGGDAATAHFCVLNSSGDVRFVSPTATCNRNETPLDIALMGPTGPTGAAGATGPTSGAGSPGPAASASATGLPRPGPTPNPAESVAVPPSVVSIIPNPITLAAGQTYYTNYFYVQYCKQLTLAASGTGEATLITLASFDGVIDYAAPDGLPAIGISNGPTSARTLLFVPRVRFRIVNGSGPANPTTAVVNTAMFYCHP